MWNQKLLPLCQVLTLSLFDRAVSLILRKETTNPSGDPEITMSSVCALCLTAASCLILPVMAMIGGRSVLNRFRVVRKLGAGSFGNVYEVEETGNETAGRMACKEIPRTADGIKDFKHVCDQTSSF